MNQMDMRYVINDVSSKYNCMITSQYDYMNGGMSFLITRNSDINPHITWGISESERTALNSSSFEAMLCAKIIGETIKAEVKFPRSDCLFIGFDHSVDGDVTALAVTRMDGTKATVLNFFTGQEACDIYTKLTGIKIEEGPELMVINPEDGTIHKTSRTRGH